MKKGENRKKILMDIIKKERAVAVVDLAERLGVSYMTIKRDAKFLEEKRVLEVINGVAVYNTESPFSSDRKYSLADACTSMTEEKNRIGLRAAALIEDNDTIIIDSGSTAEFLARHLSDDIRINILCYSMNVLAEVYKRPNCRIVFAGGYFHNNSLMFESPEGLALIKRNRATLSFVTASGVSDELGITCDNYYESPVKRAVIESSQKRVLLADSSKFGLVRSAHFADLEEFDVVVTDSGLAKSFAKTLKSMRKTLVIA